jgi:hypothetical protein
VIVPVCGGRAQQNKILDKIQIGSPLKDERQNQHMNYGDLKTLIHQRLLITFENRNFTTLIKGHALWNGPVPPWKATSNLTSSSRNYFKSIVSFTF